MCLLIGALVLSDGQSTQEVYKKKAGKVIAVFVWFSIVGRVGYEGMTEPVRGISVCATEWESGAALFSDPRASNIFPAMRMQ
jgi:hypothetical protein